MELDKNPTKTTNAISRHSLVKLGDKATVLVRYKNAKSLAEKTFTVVDSQINFIHTKSNHVMAEGLASKPFKIYGVLVGRDGKISDNRTGNHHSHNDKLASELFKQLGGKTDKLTEESVKKLPVLELTGSTTDVSLVDAKGNSISISYDTKLEGWVIDGKNIPISADYKAYTLKVIPKDTVKLDIPSLEIKIKKIAAVVQSYELVGFNSNLLGRKPFDIKAKFSDGTVKSIFDVKKGEKSPFNIKYKINNLKQNANNHAINIYNDIESTVGLINANNNSDIPVYLENKVGTYPRYIDVNGTQEFSAAYNHLYELDIEVTYTPNYIASGLNSLTPSQQLKVINSGDSEEDAWVNSVVNNKINRKFIVSDKAPTLKLEYRYYDDSISPAKYNKSSTASRLNNTHGKFNNSASLPQGGHAYNEDKKAGHLCVKALSTLEVLLDGNQTPVVVDNYKHIARLYVGSDKLTDKNESFTIYKDNETSSEFYRNSNIICAKDEAKLGSFELQSEFQNIKSNTLSLHAVAAIKSPVISFAYDNNTDKKLYIFPYNKVAENDAKQALKFHEIKLVPYYLLSNGKLGEKLSETEAKLIKFEVAGSRKNADKLNNNNSPMFIRERAGDSYLTLNYGLINSSEQQVQFVKFASNLTQPFSFLDNVYYSGVIKTVLDSKKTLTAAVNVDPSKIGFGSDDWNTSHHNFADKVANKQNAEAAEQKVTNLQAIIDGTKGLLDKEDEKIAGAPEKVRFADEALKTAKSAVSTQEGLVATAKDKKQKAVKAVSDAKTANPSADTSALEAAANTANQELSDAEKLLETNKANVETKKKELQTANKIVELAEAEKTKISSSDSDAKSKLEKAKTERDEAKKLAEKAKKAEEDSKN